MSHRAEEAESYRCPLWLTSSLVTADYDIYPRQMIVTRRHPLPKPFFELAQISTLSEDTPCQDTHAPILLLLRQILMRVDISLLGYFGNHAAYY